MDKASISITTEDLLNEKLFHRYQSNVIRIKKPEVESDFGFYHSNCKYDTKHLKKRVSTGTVLNRFVCCKDNIRSIKSTIDNVLHALLVYELHWLCTTCTVNVSLALKGP